MGVRITNTIEFKVDINLINSIGNYLPHAPMHQTIFAPTFQPRDKQNSMPTRNALWKIAMKLFDFHSHLFEKQRKN